ncbi:hypothetical protein PN466_14040 [Roseofilum reptotaenium CS-1145]|uniref:Uncharacterized protein n=1 Tax=Roseofilum reptotaenium AO1-A TaxID=1925591 RepID=A0A1L9QVZ6_9CYAN|nr:hypothetical protein [Roseofilum reptotaenium]MDB9518067.1 hypothetical protein [Roseofilum reptotaenium CS-1145]OJJ26850.1 hypothetical protein BI308_03930 [Roseofilum reptotaenium AO1-A]
MLDPANVPPVEETEILSRYVLQSRHFRKDKTPRPDLFIPHPHKDLSVTRHRDATEDELWQVGKDVAQQTNKTLYGRFEIEAKDCEIESLKVEAKPLEGNPNHADITGWPSDKPAQKALALQIAASKTMSQFIPNPGGTD